MDKEKSQDNNTRDISNRYTTEEIKEIEEMTKAFINGLNDEAQD